MLRMSCPYSMNDCTQWCQMAAAHTAALPSENRSRLTQAPKRGAERDRDRDKDTDTDRHGQTQTDTDTHRKTDTHRQTETQTRRHGKTRTDTDRHGQTRTDTDRHGHTRTHTERQTQTDRDTDTDRHGKTRTDTERQGQKQPETDRDRQTAVTPQSGLLCACVAATMSNHRCRTAAERRLQRRRADSRFVNHLLQLCDDISVHRGAAPGSMLAGINEALRTRSHSEWAGEKPDAAVQAATSEKFFVGQSAQTSHRLRRPHAGGGLLGFARRARVPSY